MPKSFSPSSPPPYDLHNFDKTASTIHLTTNETTQSKDKLREKNAEREGSLRTSDFGALLHVVKSSLGSGFLAMPSAFHNIGLLMGFTGTVLVALVCTHCTYIVVKCSQELCYQQGKLAMSYTETVEAAFTIGAKGRFQKWSKLMTYVSNFFLFITYYGVNTVYVILIASSFKQVLENHLDYTMNIRWYALILLVLLLPIGIVRHIKFLVPFSALANLFLLIGCTLTLYFCFIDMPPLSSRPLVVEVTRWPLFFSTALFGMEGIGTVMPIENAMRYPSHFLGCPGVLNLGMSVVATVFLVMGAIGYIKYGDLVQGSITLNLPQDPLSEAVKILVALAILLTYPLQLTASMEVVWQRASKCFSEKKQDQGYYIVRSLMIIGTVAIAIAVPNLSPVLSLVGAIGFSGLGLLLPTITELVTYWDVISKPFGLTIIKDAVIILIWAFATIFGTITSVQEIIVEYNISK
ncbi:proton-coupled amino acid transporter-like protein pathetic isoform X1 [Macrosteles quadrilineatus]|uniref:proton-coupled amino acid transporter-like protein pathetic isoform X1 n=1 Tax=Macrosteles quadrilineatus TaxID=74068 RepID=UPI0023E22388|nr:proton-coupled amino acid transporter-like protein pathetic isoform X1 [Macrosteles quadrilineatus]